MKSAVVRQPNWYIIGFVAIIGAFIFFWPFLGVICLAGILAYIFAPMFRVLEKHMNRRLAATLTMITTCLLVFIPLAIILTLAVSQAISFAGTLTHLSAEESRILQKSALAIVNSVNNLLAPLNNGSPLITASDIQSFVQDVIPAVINASLSVIVSIAKSLPAVMTSIIIYGFIFNTFLLHSKSIEQKIYSLSPFEDETNNLFIDRAGSIVVASLRVQTLIALVTAILSALLLIPLGFGPYFMLFVIIFTILGMVPLGSGIIVIPICIICMITGPFWPAFWVFAIYIGIVCNIDSFLRVKLMPKKAKLLPAVTTLATFCGIAYFGVLGVIYGPLIAIILMTLLEVFTLYRQNTKTPGATSKRVKELAL